MAREPPAAAPVGVAHPASTCRRSVPGPAVAVKAPGQHGGPCPWRRWQPVAAAACGSYALWRTLGDDDGGAIPRPIRGRRCTGDLDGDGQETWPPLQAANDDGHRSDLFTGGESMEEAWGGPAHDPFAAATPTATPRGAVLCLRA